MPVYLFILGGWNGLYVIWTTILRLTNTFHRDVWSNQTNKSNSQAILHIRAEAALLQTLKSKAWFHRLELQVDQEIQKRKSAAEENIIQIKEEKNVQASVLARFVETLPQKLNFIQVERMRFTQFHGDIRKYPRFKGPPKGSSKSRFHAGFLRKSRSEIAWNSCSSQIYPNMLAPDCSIMQ